MSLIRYAKHDGEHLGVTAYPREVVLLKGHPCIWGRCSFCDYIQDNTTDDDLIQQVANTELAKVTGEFGRLQVVNSGSVQELPLSVREQIRDTMKARSISEFWTESYWAYRKHYEETRRFFEVETHLFLGVETFDDELRNGLLNKSMHWSSPADVAAMTDSICLMVGFRGQSQETIRRDVDILLAQFRYGIINLFTANQRSEGLLDEDIKAWFREEYAWLKDEPNIDVLWHNTDFGIG